MGNPIHRETVVWTPAGAFYCRFKLPEMKSEPWIGHVLAGARLGSHRQLVTEESVPCQCPISLYTDCMHDYAFLKPMSS